MDNLLYPLKYHHLFGQALTLEELYFWQYKTKFSRKKIYQELAYLIKKGQVKRENDYYFISSFPFVFKKEEEYRLNASKKKKIAQKGFEQLYKPKELVFAGLTGSVAAGFSHKDDDLDIVIVTQEHSLWLSRFKFYLFNPHLKRRRPKQKKNLRNLFCFNMWLEINQLEFPANIYTATEILNLKPIYDPHNLYYLWLEKNSWIKKTFPQAWQLKQTKLKTKKNKVKPARNRLANLFAYFLQWLYMLPKRSKEQVSLSKALFHKYNYSSLINKRLKTNEDSFRPLRRC